MTYTIFEHRHRFAAWAASRASSRRLKGGKTKPLMKALEACGVYEFCKSPNYNMSKAEFDKNHSLWCNSIMQFWENEGFDYGRAAKLVNMYLKSMIVMVEPDSNLAKVIHPPIDSVLLKALASKHGTTVAHFRTLTWTNFDEALYFKTVSEVLALIPKQPAWKIEENWLGYQ